LNDQRGALDRRRVLDRNAEDREGVANHSAAAPPGPRTAARAAASSST
jgi:hypothetical protein